jgi:hypothetical protein
VRPINLQLHNVRTPNAGRELCQYHGQQRAREWMQQQRTTDDGAFIRLAGQVPWRTHLQVRYSHAQSKFSQVQSNTVTDGCEDLKAPSNRLPGPPTVQHGCCAPAA